MAPIIFQISIFAQLSNLEFNHFLLKDDEPLLFHTALRGMLPEIHEAVLAKNSAYIGRRCATLFVVRSRPNGRR
jgi:hypothetical protein